MSSANDFLPLPAAQYQLCSFSCGPVSSFGQKFRRAMRRLVRARTWWWGPLLSQVILERSRCFASIAFDLPLFFTAADLRAERQTQSRGEDSRLSSFDLRQVRGRGQNCFVKPEKPSWGATNPSPVPASVDRPFPGYLLSVNVALSTPPAGTHLLPIRTFRHQNTPRRCDAISDRAPRGKSTACRLRTAHR
jgi:hypothetical protein